MVRFRAGLVLGLGLTVDTQIGTIMTINEDPSPNLHLYILAILICGLVDLSTCRPVDLVLLSIRKIRLGLWLDSA